jgi:hypothetical protein
MNRKVTIPAYEAMRKDGRLADRMLEILLDVGLPHLGVQFLPFRGVTPLRVF